MAASMMKPTRAAALLAALVAVSGLNTAHAASVSHSTAQFDTASMIVPRDVSTPERQMCLYYAYSPSGPTAASGYSDRNMEEAQARALETCEKHCGYPGDCQVATDAGACVSNRPNIAWSIAHKNGDPTVWAVGSGSPRVHSEMIDLNALYNCARLVDAPAVDARFGPDGPMPKDNVDGTVFLQQYCTLLDAVQDEYDSSD